LLCEVRFSALLPQLRIENKEFDFRNAIGPEISADNIAGHVARQPINCRKHVLFICFWSSIGLCDENVCRWTSKHCPMADGDADGMVYDLTCPTTSFRRLEDPLLVQVLLIAVWHLTTTHPSYFNIHQVPLFCWIGI
jgi:hypothetical protein